ncbi:MAG: 50S ribosomal protein L29 [Candidatus Heimdallarchaeota archaeon]|nr:50S ribosomal protein L29 [Candidatus Heimdallarchaeota archaeon]
MTIMRTSEIRRLDPQQRQNRLDRYRKDLMTTRSQLSAGGSIDNPSRIRDLKKTIARILTIQNEERSKE